MPIHTNKKQQHIYKFEISMPMKIHIAVLWLITSRSSHRNSEIYNVSVFRVEVYMGLSHREEKKLRIFENRVLRSIFGSKKDEDRGEWRKLHSLEPHQISSR
jgi:hypothetical protein